MGTTPILVKKMIYHPQCSASSTTLADASVSVRLPRISLPSRIRSSSTSHSASAKIYRTVSSITSGRRTKRTGRRAHSIELLSPYPHFILPFRSWLRWITEERTHKRLTLFWPPNNDKIKWAFQQIIRIPPLSLPLLLRCKGAA